MATDLDREDSDTLANIGKYLERIQKLMECLDTSIIFHAWLSDNHNLSIDEVLDKREDFHFREFERTK